MATNSISTLGQIAFKNIANICSILGVLPFILLLQPNGFQFLPVLIIYNNVMDDLDGYLAKVLGIRSAFGAQIDNLCDGIVHILVVWTVAVHYSEITIGLALLVTVSMIIRVTTRLADLNHAAHGSATNELMRHMLFLLVLEIYFDVQIEYYLMIVFCIHSLTLIAPFPMSKQLRALSNSFWYLCLINLSLGMALFFPVAAPFIMAAFMLTYLYSFLSSGFTWIGRSKTNNA